MSKKRQAGIYDRLGNRGAQIVTLRHDYPAGHFIPAHFHDRDQLVYASSGVMSVHTDEGAWVVPAQRAVWIPARVPHSLTMSGVVAMRTLYFKPGLVKTLPAACCVVNVSRLLRELILHSCTFGTLRTNVRRQRHLIDLITDQFASIDKIPLQLPHVSDPRALGIARLLMAAPSDRRTLAQLCKSAGASRRTMERLFKQETGVTFGRWRQQLRIMAAVRLLAEGAKVTHAALEAGYSTPSAFIAAFKKALGTTPASYFHTNEKEPE